MAGIGRSKQREKEKKKEREAKNNLPSTGSFPKSPRGRNSIQVFHVRSKDHLLKSSPAASQGWDQERNHILNPGSLTQVVSVPICLLTIVQGYVSKQLASSSGCSILFLSTVNDTSC